MRQRKHGTLLAVLALLSIALLGSEATSAQAHEWLIGGQTLQEVEAKGEAEEGATLSSNQKSELFTFDWPLSFHHYEWACTKESGTGLLWPNTKTHDAFSTATLKWSNCFFTEAYKICGIHGPIVAQVKGELVKNEKTGILYQKYTPNGVLLAFSWGFDECAVGGLWSFGGSFSAQLEPAGTELFTHPQTFSPAIDEAMGTAIKANESTPPVRISGALNMTLSGELEGRKWGAT